MIKSPVTLSGLAVRARSVLRSLDTARTPDELYWNYTRLVAILSAAGLAAGTSPILARATAQLARVLVVGLESIQVALPRGFAATKNAILEVAQKVLTAVESAYVN